MSNSLREILRLMSDGWSLHVRATRPRPTHGRSVGMLRRGGEVREALAGPVRSILSLRLVEEVGRHGEEVTYSLTEAGQEAIRIHA